MADPTAVSSATPDDLVRFCAAMSAFAGELARWAGRVGADRRLVHPAGGLQLMSGRSGDIGRRVEVMAREFAAADAAITGVLSVAQGEVGYREGPDNDNKFGRWYGANHEAWCAMFVSWAFARSGRPLPDIQGPHGFARVAHVFAWARTHRRLSRTPQRGDIFLIAHGRGRGHTGIVKGVNADGSITTIEGNTNARGSRSGDGVYERTRLVSSINAGFVRIEGEVTDEQRWEGPDRFAGSGRRGGAGTRHRKRR